MDEIRMDNFSMIYSQIEELANGERSGANHYDYPPNIDLYETLVRQFYETASRTECTIDVMETILDGQRSLNREFMYLRSRQCINKFEAMKNILSEIDSIIKK